MLYGFYLTIIFLIIITYYVNKSYFTSPSIRSQMAMNSSVYMPPLVHYHNFYGMWISQDGMKMFQIEQIPNNKFIFTRLNTTTKLPLGNSEIVIHSDNDIITISDGTNMTYNNKILSTSNGIKYTKYSPAVVRINSNMKFNAFHGANSKAFETGKWKSGNKSFIISAGVLKLYNGTLDVTLTSTNNMQLYGSIPEFGFFVISLSNDKKQILMETDNPINPIYIFTTS